MNKNIKILIGVTLSIAIVATGSFVYIKDKGSEASKLGVKDPIESKDTEGNLNAPYNISKEVLEKEITGDSYIQSIYNIEKELTEEVSNLDNEDTFTSTKTIAFNGIYKGTDFETDMAHIFYADIKTYNTFDNPSSLSISYGFNEDSEIEAIENSASSIIAKLFNKEVSNLLFNGEKIVSKSVQSKSGEYSLNLSKVTEKNILSITVDFNKTIPESYNLANHKVDSDLNQLYTEFDVFNTESIVDITTKYSELTGDYTDSRLLYLLNKKKETQESTINTSIIAIRTVYDDGVGTTGEVTFVSNTDKDGKNAIDKILYEASLRYRETTEQVLNDAANIIKGLTGIEIVLTDTEKTDGKLTRDIKLNKFETESTVNVLIETAIDENGTYGRIIIENK